MAQFTVNPQRFDPYKNFKFRVKWDGKHVAGISKVSALKRATEVIEHREGGDPSTSRKLLRHRKPNWRVNVHLHKLSNKGSNYSGLTTNNLEPRCTPIYE